MGSDAARLIDELLNVYVQYPEAPQANVTYDDVRRRYDFVIFAERQPWGIGFSRQAMDELAELIKDAPFDIGYDNIFSDHNGDAVIIDTEFKGEQDCLGKLIGRYTRYAFKNELIEKYFPQKQSGK